MTEAPRSTTTAAGGVIIDPVDGSPMVPTNPAVARSRLSELEADKSVVDALLDPLDPMHELRTLERRGLLAVSFGGPAPTPKTNEEEQMDARAKQLGDRIRSGIDAPNAS